MKTMLQKITAGTLGLAVAVALAGCGGGSTTTAAETPAETTEATEVAAEAEEAVEEATEAAEEATEDAEEAVADAGVPPAEGEGGSVDAGYLLFDVPDGVKWDYSQSPYSGNAMTRVYVGSFPAMVGEFEAWATKMADSFDSALTDLVFAFDAQGLEYTEPTQVTYGDYTYWQTYVPGREAIFLATYDEPSGLYIEHQLDANEDGSAFAEPESVEAILGSLKIQAMDPIE